MLFRGLRIQCERGAKWEDEQMECLRQEPVQNVVN